MKTITTLLGLFCLPIILLAQCPADLTVTNGSTGTWVNTSSGVATVKITAIGAGGGKNTVVSLGGEGQVNNLLGGRGATMSGTFTVAPGASLLLIAGSPGNNSQNGGAGGGGSGVVNCGNPSNCSTGTILIIAGGGGGTSGFVAGGGGKTVAGSGGGGTNAGQNAAGGGGLNAQGQGGLNGATGGGQVSKSGLSAGGSAGTPSNGIPGAAGGSGMGGGGASDAAGTFAAGGGGQTGGNAEDYITTAQGGNSFNAGNSQTNSSGTAGGGANVGSVTVQCLSILPVELVSISAKVMDEEVILLNWQTASERDNQGFEVQRMSLNSSRWSEIGFVPGNGTTTEAHDYTFTDEKPLPGTNYYRLRQVDFDGGEELSKVVSIDFRNLQDFGNLSIFPNPVHDGELNLYFGEMLEEGTTAEIHLFDALGRRVKTAFVENTDTTTLSIDGLPAGTYLLEVAVDQQRLHQKIIVQ